MSELLREQPQTHVKVGLKYLKNLGNFENITIEVEIQDQVRHGETVDDALDRVFAKVEEQLAERTKQLLER